MLQPGARDAMDREKAIRLIAELQEVSGRLEDFSGGCGPWPRKCDEISTPDSQL